MSVENRSRGDIVATDNAGLLFVSSVATASHLLPDCIGRVEATDETNLVHLRVRKTPVSINISDLLEKVAKSGEYDAPTKQLLARRSTNRRIFTKSTCGNQTPGLLLESTVIKCKPDFQGHRKIQKLFRQKRRNEESTPLKPIASNQKRNVSELSIHHSYIDLLHSSGKKKLRNLVWGGIPSSIRGAVWSSLVGNALNIDRTLYEHCLQLSKRHLQHPQRGIIIEELMPNEFGDLLTNSDLPAEEKWKHNCEMCSLILANFNSTPMRQELCLFCPSQTGNLIRKSGTLGKEDSSHYNWDRSAYFQFVKQDMTQTFPTLRLFQLGCPFHAKLHDLLAAYVIYRPQIGYIHGMSYLVAVLLLVMSDPFDAFVLFANLLEKPCHRAFYSPDESEFMIYFRAFSQLLADRLPHLHAHFMQVGLEPNMYLFDWLFNIYSRVLPLEAALRVWDLYCAEGDLILFRVAAALLTHYESCLLQYGFDQLVAFLTTPMPSDLTGDQLVKQIHSFRLKRKIWRRYLERSLSGAEPRTTERTWSHIVSTSTANPILHKLGSKQQFSRQKSMERFLEMEHFDCTKSLNQSFTNLDFESLATHNLRPGLVDHSIFTLTSLTPSSSLLGTEEDMDVTDLAYNTPAFVSSSVQADELDALESSPWSAGIISSPSLFATFGFDGIPMSAPPDSQRMLAKHRNLPRWASDWNLSHSDFSSGLSRIGRNAASIHDMGTLVGCSIRPHLTPALSRSLSSVFFPPIWKEEQPIKHRDAKTHRSTRLRLAQTELIS